MKRNNKKGFTIVELVIVIAVIGILAAVLIPTFTSITEKAKESGALQKAAAAKTVVIAMEDGELDSDCTYYFTVDGYWFMIENGELKEAFNKGTVKTIGAEDEIYDADDTLPSTLTPGADVTVTYKTLSDAEKSDLGAVTVWKDKAAA